MVGVVGSGGGVGMTGVGATGVVTSAVAAVCFAVPECCERVVGGDISPLFTQASRSGPPNVTFVLFRESSC